MTYENFKEEWDMLSDDDKCTITLDYLQEEGSEEQWYEFDEIFFETFFMDNPIEAARAVFFGKIENWMDEYIRFNAYGNLESGTKWDVIREAEGYYLENIFEHPEYWDEYITAEVCEIA